MSKDLALALQNSHLVWDQAQIDGAVEAIATQIREDYKGGERPVYLTLMHGGMDSVLGWLVDLVGGRQSARTWHFIFCFAFVAFILVHLFMVVVTGPINQVRAMITGNYRVHDAPPEPPHAAD